MNKSLLAIACSIAFCAPAQASDCKYEKPLDVNLDTGFASNLAIDAGAGSLTIVGVEGLDEVQVKARACASSENILDDIDLISGQRGKSVTLRTETPDLNSWTGNRYAYIDLRIRMPASMAAEVDDGSGSVEIEGIAALTIDDGSGSLEIHHISGDVSVNDGSGSIDITDIGGTLELEDGSGEIDIDGVQGSVHIDEDGSGSIEIANVTRDVEIDEDGSGSIVVRDVGGNVTVGRDGSGSIDVRSIAGDFRVDRDGSGSISFASVQGKVSVPNDNRQLK